MTEEWLRRAINAAAGAITENASLLDELDAAIGDGDHGSNLSRGFRAVAALADELADLDLGRALHQAGMTLVTTVGGAAGPLYGSLLMGMGKAAPPDRAATPADFSAMLRQGIDAMQQRGKAGIGEKTMLDVLAPVAEALDSAVGEGVGGLEIAARLVAAAEAGVDATRAMQATKGRAAQLGERSIGHRDPGAMAAFLLVRSLCEGMSERGSG